MADGFDFRGGGFFFGQGHFAWVPPPPPCPAAAQLLGGAPRGRVVEGHKRPNPPWWLIAGTHSVRAVATLAALSFLLAGHFDDQVQEVLRAVAVVACTR